jgi:hypothetical protein
VRTTIKKTKREAVEPGLRTLPALKKQGAIRELTGKLAWQGDLDAMRTDVLPVTGADLDEIFAHEDSDS